MKIFTVQPWTLWNIFSLPQKNSISLEARRAYFLGIQALAPTKNASIFIRQIQCNPLWWQMTMHSKAAIKDGSHYRLRHFATRATRLLFSADKNKKDGLLRLFSLSFQSPICLPFGRQMRIFRYFSFFASLSLRPKWNTVCIENGFQGCTVKQRLEQQTENIEWVHAFVSIGSVSAQRTIVSP